MPRNVLFGGPWAFDVVVLLLIATTATQCWVQAEETLCPEVEEASLRSCGTFCPNGDTLTAEQRSIQAESITFRNVTLESVTCGYIEDNIFPCLEADQWECGAVHYQAIRDCKCEASPIPLVEEEPCFLCPTKEPYTANPDFLVDPSSGMTCQLAAWYAYSQSGPSKVMKKNCWTIQKTLGVECGCPEGAPNLEEDPVVCAADVTQCPDGSYVSRDAAKNCEFGDCPSVDGGGAAAEVRCQEDVQQCPNGTTVSRDAQNNCQFPACPSDNGKVCAEDVKKCTDGSSVGRDPQNNCEFADCLDEVVCAQEVKDCPDGSSVGRNPKNDCEFFNCPDDDNGAMDTKEENEEEEVFCAADVNECPDGSYVSRDATNNCEFAPCPSPPITGLVENALFCPQMDKTLLHSCGTFCPNGDVVPEEKRSNRLDITVRNHTINGVTCEFVQNDIYPCLQAESLECEGVISYHAVVDCGCDGSGPIPPNNNNNNNNDPCFLCPHNEPYTADPNLVVDSSNGMTCQLASWWAYSKSGSSETLQKECREIQQTLGAACQCPNVPCTANCEGGDDVLVKNHKDDDPTSCEEDVKECWDGSLVHRNAENNCEFDKCPQDLVVCPADVQECEDGSYVGRDVTNYCEFYPCPSSPTTSSSRTTTNYAALSAIPIVLVALLIMGFLFMRRTRSARDKEPRNKASDIGPDDAEVFVERGETTTMTDFSLD